MMPAAIEEARVRTALGTMITYGYPDIELADELSLAVRLGVEVLEILPEWGRFPDPALVRARRPTGACRSTAPTAAGAAGPSARLASTWARPTRRPTASRSTT